MVAHVHGRAFGDNVTTDFTSAPVVVSLILGGILLLLLIFCRAYMLCRKRKFRSPAARPRGADNAIPTPGFRDEPPSYEDIGSASDPATLNDVPGVYLNMGLADDDETPPPKYYDIVKESPPMATIPDSQK